MSLRLRLLNVLLRRFVKPAMAGSRSYERMQRDLARCTDWHARFVAPFNLMRDRFPCASGWRAANWVSRAHPERRRVILYLHGGAYVIGSPDTRRVLCAELSESAHARVFCPAYRLAPESPFPAALEDVLKAWQHLRRSGLRPGEIAIAGDSAGGGLALALTLALQRRDAERPAALVLFSPWTDLTLSGASIRENARRDPMIPVARANEIVSCYLRGEPAANPLASPLFGDFHAPPPVMLCVSESEVLRDDGLRMAETLVRAGGDVRLETHPWAPHSWPLFSPWLEEGRTTILRAGAFLHARWER